MEMKEIKAIVADIIVSIENSKYGYAKRDFENFAEGAYNKTASNKKLLRSFDRQFKNNGLTLHQGDEEYKSILEFSKGERITFRKKDTVVSEAEEEVQQLKADYKPAGTTKISEEESGINLQKHQEEAIEKLQSKIVESNKTPFEGLLVLPTGGGKTLTSAYWIAKNYLDKGKKVLWIAHRHELLEQAQRTFSEKLCYKDILPSKEQLNYRLLSGIHDKPYYIKPTDDIIISSKDCLNTGFDYLYSNWLKHNNKELFLVIDEAHHATAKTYRKLIAKLKEKVINFRLLGLTATPFRTLEEEKGLLAKVFPDGIVHKEDLRTLISRGFLSHPVFEEEKTGFEISLNDEDLELLSKNFDIERIGSETARTIAENKQRNWSIVNRYIKNKDKYKQTIVFALNKDNAIALNKLFQEQSIKSDFVISAIRDMATGATLKKDAAEIISRFRRGELEVLINVNILTEGTDIPNVQSVFLARPTISPILMTQMIGRGLRGESAGGTKEAYIVSFVDEWRNRIEWVNPEKLFIEENIDFNDKKPDTRNQLTRLVAISKIEEFASLANKTIASDKREELERLEFIERIPLGIYHFSILQPVENEAHEKNCEVLLYDSMYQSYTDFVKALPAFFQKHQLTERDSLTEKELETFAGEIKDSFFADCPQYPAFYLQDVKDILQYYAQKDVEPKYIELKDREKYDIGKIASHIVEQDLGQRAANEYKNQLWESNETEWKAFFGFDKKAYFLNEIDLAVRRLSNPDLFKRPAKIPVDLKEKRPYNAMSMADLMELDPVFEQKLRDEIYEKHKDNEGFYVSATGKFKSKNRGDFQIDHEIPFKDGGPTDLSNLQLLSKDEHRDKTQLENAVNRAANE